MTRALYVSPRIDRIPQTAAGYPVIKKQNIQSNMQLGLLNRYRYQKLLLLENANTKKKGNFVKIYFLKKIDCFKYCK